MIKVGDKLPEAPLNHDGVVKIFNPEKPGAFEVSSAEKMLGQV